MCISCGAERRVTHSPLSAFCLSRHRVLECLNTRLPLPTLLCRDKKIYNNQKYYHTQYESYTSSLKFKYIFYKQKVEVILTFNLKKEILFFSLFASPSSHRGIARYATCSKTDQTLKKIMELMWSGKYIFCMEIQKAS